MGRRWAAMNLDIYLDSPFDDDDAFMDFLGAHEVSHQTIASKLIGSGKLVAMIPLSDVPQDNPDWMLDHYKIHREIAQAMNFSVPDLASVDFDDEAQYTDWMQLHAQIHHQINDSLGIKT